MINSILQQGTCHLSSFHEGISKNTIPNVQFLGVLHTNTRKCFNYKRKRKITMNWNILQIKKTERRNRFVIGNFSTLTSIIRCVYRNVWGIKCLFIKIITWPFTYLKKLRNVTLVDEGKVKFSSSKSFPVRSAWYIFR